MTIISMTTDFGLQDGFVGVMKGIILGIAPQAQIVDLSHQVPPQNVSQGAYLLRRHAQYFPAGSVHLAVIDPGVGTQRRPLAARLGGQYFVAPDNGLLYPLMQAVGQSQQEARFVHLDQERYWLPQVSRTFHGRDIFAPAAAYLALGVPLQELGSVIDDPQALQLPEPQPTSSGWQAHVTSIDRFGNLAIDLPAGHIVNPAAMLIQIGGVQITGLVHTYGDRQVGELVALSDSAGYLEIAEVNGSAARRLNAEVGDLVEVLVRSSTPG